MCTIGPRARARGKKKELGNGGVEICLSVCPERSKGEEAWGETVGNYNRVKYVFGTY